MFKLSASLSGAVPCNYLLSIKKTAGLNDVKKTQNPLLTRPLPSGERVPMLQVPHLHPTSDINIANSAGSPDQDLNLDPATVKPTR